MDQRCTLQITDTHAVGCMSPGHKGCTFEAGLIHRESEVSRSPEFKEEGGSRAPGSYSGSLCTQSGAGK